MSGDIIENLALKNRCSGPDDFVKPAARQLIYSVCNKFLEGQKAGVLELLHSKRLQNSFSNMGDLRATGVQRIAIAQVKGLQEDVQDRLKSLDSFIDTRIKKCWTADKEKATPTIDPKALDAGLSTTLQKKDNIEKRFQVFSAITKHMDACKTIAEKLEKLNDLITVAEDEELVTLLDVFAGDLLTNQTFWHEALKDINMLGEKAWSLIALIERKKDAITPEIPAFNIVQEIYAKPVMVETRQALMAQLEHLLKNRDPLTKDTLITEAKESRRLYHHLSEHPQSIYSAEVLEELKKRVSRLVDYESTHIFLDTLPADLLKIGACLELYNCAFKAKDREILASIFKNLVDRWDPAQDFKFLPGEAPEKIKNLTDISVNISRSQLPETTRNDYSEKLQKLTSTP